MSISAHDVARELRHRLGENLGTIKLHKLLYYAQGWHIAWTGRPLFREDVEAWENGPVVADLWHDEDKMRPSPSASTLDPEASLVVEYVVSRYGGLTGQQLIAETHREAPWRNVWAGGDGVNGEITPELLRQCFTDIEDAADDVSEQVLGLLRREDVRAAVAAAKVDRDSPVRDERDDLLHLAASIA